MEHTAIRENIPQYMTELKAWLGTIEDVPLEEMGAFFAARLGEYEDHMARWKEGYRLLARLVPETARTVLDLGCGTGLELDALFALRRNIAVTGVDLCPEMLAKLKEKHPQVFTVCGDYFSVDLGRGRYDCAITFESLHHFSPEQKFGLFQKVFHALKPGSVYVEADYLACCQEEQDLLMDFCQRKRREQNIPPERFVHFDTPLTPAVEMALLQKAGFEDVQFLTAVEGCSFLCCRKGCDG